LTIKAPTEIPQDEWEAQAKSRFGADTMAWRFVCPSCGHVASVKDWKDAGAMEGEVAFSCVGRRLENRAEAFRKPGPCNYAGGGLFAINPVHVKLNTGGVIAMFDFAPT
jgi:hypothetical protein